MSTKQESGENSLFKLSKEENTLFKQLLVFIIRLLILKYCFRVRSGIAIQYSIAFFE